MYTCTVATHSELLEAYSRCSSGSEVIAVQDRWLEEARKEQLTKKESERTLSIDYIYTERRLMVFIVCYS